MLESARKASCSWPKSEAVVPLFKLAIQFAVHEMREALCGLYHRMSRASRGQCRSLRPRLSTPFEGGLRWLNVRIDGSKPWADGVAAGSGRAAQGATAPPWTR